MDWKDQLKLFAQTNSLPDAPPDREPVNHGATTAPKRTERLQVVFERKGRRGKSVTIVAGFSCGFDEMRAVLSKLQKKLGVGGSASGNEILIQGDHRDRIAALLRQEGYRI